MLADKVKELANDLRRLHLEFKKMKSDLRVQGAKEREIDIDEVIEKLGNFKLNVTYLKLKAIELRSKGKVNFDDVYQDLHYFMVYLKNASETFDEIGNSMTFRGRSGDEVAIPKATEELLILQRQLTVINTHLADLNAKLK